MRGDQSSGLSQWQFGLLAVLGLVALCSLLGAAFVFINRQLNPPVPTPLPTHAPSLPSATRDLTVPRTATRAGVHIETLAPLASETLALLNQEASATLPASDTPTATPAPNTAAAPGLKRTAQTPNGPATAAQTQPPALMAGR